MASNAIRGGAGPVRELAKIHDVEYVDCQVVTGAAQRPDRLARVILEAATEPSNLLA